jgi:hypothetical protein
MHLIVQIMLLLLVFFVLYYVFSFVYDLWKNGLLYENVLLLVFVVGICYLLVKKLLEKV